VPCPAMSPPPFISYVAEKRRANKIRDSGVVRASHPRSARRATMNYAQLAWSLAETCSHCLNESEKCAVYVALGSGDTRTLVTRSVSRSAALTSSGRLRIQVARLGL
jgi:hypothetical protein